MSKAQKITEKETTKMQGPLAPTAPDQTTIATKETFSTSKQVPDSVPDFDSMVPPGPGAKKETRGRPKKEKETPVLMPEIEPEFYAGIFLVVSEVLQKRFGDKWKFSDDEIKSLCTAFAPLAKKYGASFIQFFPEFMFVSTALTVIMKRI